MDQTVFGLSESAWDRFAGSHSKAAIFNWLLVSWGYNWWHGKLLSLSSVLLFFPGIFVASFLCCAGFLLLRPTKPDASGDRLKAGACLGLSLSLVGAYSAARILADLL